MYALCRSEYVSADELADISGESPDMWQERIMDHEFNVVVYRDGKPCVDLSLLTLTGKIREPNSVFQEYQSWVEMAKNNTHFCNFEAIMRSVTAPEWKYPSASLERILALLTHDWEASTERLIKYFFEFMMLTTEASSETVWYEIDDVAWLLKEIYSEGRSLVSWLFIFTSSPDGNISTEELAEKTGTPVKVWLQHIQNKEFPGVIYRDGIPYIARLLLASKGFLPPTENREK